jgi:hypothetical protein
MSNSEVADSHFPIVNCELSATVCKLAIANLAIDNSTPGATVNYA